jgi:hypothetical protein
MMENLEGRRLMAGVFQETGGLVVAEIESNAPGQWTRKTSPSGFTGSAAFQWNGQQYFSTRGVAALAYDVKINNPGTYNLKLRSFNPTSDNKEHNDVWIRIDGGQWFKTFTHVKQAWTYVTRREISHGNFDTWRPNLSAGNHRIEIAARSSLYTLDRLVLHKDGVNGETPSTPQSSTSGGGVVNPPPTSDALKVNSFSLVNADTNRVISGFENLTSNRRINFSALPTRNLAIQVNTASGVKSVRLTLNGGSARTENIKPFALFGDNNGDFNAWRPNAGSFTIAATGFAGTGATGARGATLSVTLTFA